MLAPEIHINHYDSNKSFHIGRNYSHHKIRKDKNGSARKFLGPSYFDLALERLADHPPQRVSMHKIFDFYCCKNSKAKQKLKYKNEKIQAKRM